MLNPEMSSASPREKFAELRGLRFHWVEWGEPASPAVVALHGLSAMCRIWDTLGNALQDRYRVIALDQRGHGETGWPDQPNYSTDDYVADVEALFTHLNLNTAALIGLSMGGMNALAFAAANPQRVSRLVAVDIRPALDPDKRPNRDQDRRTADSGHAVLPSLEAAFLARKFMHPLTPDAVVRHHVQHLYKQLADGGWTNKHDPRVSYYWKPRNLWSDLAGIPAPVLIIRGGQSPVLPEKVAIEMQDAFPSAELLTIENAAHTVPEDQPAEFVSAIELFLAHDPI